MRAAQPTSELPEMLSAALIACSGWFCARELAAARTREERLHAHLVDVAKRNLASAWCCSTHHSWMEDAWDFVCEDCNCWWRYESEGDD